MEVGQTAIGTWSGGRFMHFGEELETDRLRALLRPDGDIATVLTADVYGEGAADALLGESLDGMVRDDYCLVGAVGHDFYEGDRDGPRGFPRFTDPRLRGPGEYRDYLRMAAERSLARLGASAFDALLLHNPDRTGYESEIVWEAMAGLREDGLADEIGVAPGPANGFTLDLIGCLERFGELIDWAMIILNPLEPWPGELVLDAAGRSGVRVITRVVDYGGLFWGDLDPHTPMGDHDHRRFRPAGWIEDGLAKIERMATFADRAGLTPLQLACAWNLSHPAVECVVPTLIQEAGPSARPIEDKRAELAALPGGRGLAAADVEAIGAIGDNKGCMALKGASPEHEGEERPDRWSVTSELRGSGLRFGIDPERDLVKASGP